MVWPISASGERLKRICCTVAKRGCFAHAGLATLTSRAVKRGHGIQCDGPPVSGLRNHCTVRSPLIATGRLIDALMR